MSEFERARRGIDKQTANALLRSSREKLSEHCAAALARMLDKVDDALFELAEKAENNAIQTLYFDAMREVRIKRKSMERTYKAALIDGFNAEISGEGSGSHEDGLADAGLELGLVDDDELEENLAVMNMIQKIESNCRQELGLLDKRMGFLLEDPELEGANNPVGPAVICNAFYRACDNIDSELKVKLIILKLYDRYVVSNDVLPLYQSLNRFLIDKGVLPDIRLEVRKSAQSRGGGSAAAPAAGAPAEGGGAPQPTDGEGPDLFTALQQCVPGGVIPGLGGSGVPAAGSGGGMGIGGTVPSGFMQGLTALQQGGSGYTGGAIDQQTVAAGTVNVIRDIKSTAVGEGVGGLDAIIIDVVAMLFDYILDDHNIPDPMKALIGRLQIPMLKIAMQDKEFFTRKSHPARQLLNAIAEAAAGWNADAGDDPLYNELDRIVQRVVNEFDQETALFDELVDELAAFQEAEQEKAQREVEESARLLRSKDNLKQAKERVSAEIERRMQEQSVPAFVRAFLTTYWQNLLLIVHVREGEDSLEWKQVLNTTDNLLWSIQSKRASEREALVRLLPRLLENLREGMNLVAMSPESMQAFLTQLADLHAAVVQRARADADPSAAVESAADPLAEVDDGDEEIVTLMEAEVRETGPATLHRLLDEQGLTESDVEEITLGDPGEAEEIEDHFIEMARSLTQGSWVEFVKDDGSSVRAKLTWVSPVTGNYLFTNRTGHKEADMTLHGLAAEFRRGSAVMIDAVPLFDRAVSNLIDGLREHAAGA